MSPAATPVILFGASGRMGQEILRLAPDRADIEIVAALIRPGARLLGEPVWPDRADALAYETVLEPERRADVLVRVRPDADAEVAEREVHLAAALADAGVAVTDLVDAADQPFHEGGSVVTAWRWVEGSGAVEPAELGHLARTLRERTADVARVIVERVEAR